MSELLQFLKSVAVGAIASVADFVLLVVTVELFKTEPTIANVPCLFAGVCIQFWGSRHFTFNAANRPIIPQARAFLIAEIVTLILNALVFQIFVTAFKLHYAVARPLGTFIVFGIFSYPIWKMIFQTKELR